tara:strand:+ start:108 stop:419 length:312 start_codon:yes stop_codon:yes gene_type:complete
MIRLALICLPFLAMACSPMPGMESDLSDFPEATIAGLPPGFSPGDVPVGETCGDFHHSVSTSVPTEFSIICTHSNGMQETTIMNAGKEVLMGFYSVSMERENP